MLWADVTLADLQIVSVAQLQHLLRLSFWLPPEQEAEVLIVLLQGVWLLRWLPIL